MTTEMQEELMVEINSAVPGLAKVMTSDDLVEILTKYTTEQPDDMPDGGADLVENVVQKTRELDAAIDALNDSFRESCEGIMVLTGPEFRIMTVEFIREEVPLADILGDDNV